MIFCMKENSFEKEVVSIEKFKDFRSVDLSTKNLSEVPKEILITADFDTRTIWPESDKLPLGFNPEEIIEKGKDPGLGVIELHKEGIDGRGVTVAIIDQSLASKRGEFMPHQEYASNIVDYKEFGLPEDEGVSMHGPAVTSLLVGKTCGIAPEAKLVYIAVPSGRDFNLRADALLDIIERNKTLAQEDKVRIVNCSIGYMEKNPEAGLDRWIETIKKAEEEGIIISDVGDRTGVDYIGGGTSNEKEDTDYYDQALFLQEMNKADTEGLKDRIIIPSDYRTMASSAGPEEYMYNSKGGMSWSVPYLTGIFALVLQIKPDLKKEQIAQIINKTATVNNKGLKVINPKGIIEAVKNL